MSFRVYQDYAGVYFQICDDGPHKGDTLYHISYRSPDGKQHNEKAGYKNRDGMTEDKAEYMRLGKMHGKEKPKTTSDRNNARRVRYGPSGRLWKDYDAKG